MKKMTALLGLSLIMCACMPEESPPVTQNRMLPPKIALDVQAITLADRSGLQPVSSPYSTNHFSPTISDAIKQWASDRLQAAGPSGQAIIVVKDASLVSQALPMKSGPDSWFTRQQGLKYTGHAELSIEANGREGFATTDAVATRSVTLPEDPTESERQEAYFALLNGLMKDLGQNLEASIGSHMAPFIVTAPIYGMNPSPVSNAAPMTTFSQPSPVYAASEGLPPPPNPNAPRFVSAVAAAPQNVTSALSPLPPPPQVMESPYSLQPPVQVAPPLVPMAGNRPVSIPLSGPYSQ